MLNLPTSLRVAASLRGVVSEHANRVIRLFESRGQLDRVAGADRGAAQACLERAKSRLAAARLLEEAEHWEAAYTTAYDAYRTSADAVVLELGFRVPATAGAHRVAADVAHAVLRDGTDAFSPPTAERFREGRHESEYFDPERPVDKTAADAAWAIERAQLAVTAAVAALSAR